MDIRYCLIEKVKFDKSKFVGFSDSDFKEVIRGGKEYVYCYCFSEYAPLFDIVFETLEDYETWLNDFCYFIIPNEIIPQISHYSGWIIGVKDELTFNLTLNKGVYTIDGVDYELATNSVQMIVCYVNRWVDEGVNLLEAIIELWNNDNPTKIINHPIMFDSYKDVVAFIDSKK